jgi:hypothetical protein
MTIALEEFTEWRDSVEGRLHTLEAMGEQYADKFRHNDAALGTIDGTLSRFQAEFRAQRSMLQALHLTQNEHTETLRKHTATLNEHSAALRDLKAGQAETMAGIKVIIGLLNAADRDESQTGR